MSWGVQALEKDTVHVSVVTCVDCTELRAVSSHQVLEIGAFQNLIQKE